MAKIFISYRRDDAKADARHIHDRLRKTFGRKSVFMDVDNLFAGQRFDHKLNDALKDCDVLLAIIGPGWMDIMSGRLADAEQDPDARDYVRDEIAAALKREIIVIPVLVDGAALPARSALPDDIQDVVLYQKHDVSHENFGRDIDALVQAIRATRRARPTSTLSTGAKWSAVTAIALLGIGGALWASTPQPLDRLKEFLSAQPPREAERRKAVEKADAEQKAKAEAQRLAVEAKRKADEAADAWIARENAAAQAIKKVSESDRTKRYYDCLKKDGWRWSSEDDCVLNTTKPTSAINWNDECKLLHYLDCIDQPACFWSAYASCRARNESEGKQIKLDQNRRCGSSEYIACIRKAPHCLWQFGECVRNGTDPAR